MIVPYVDCAAIFADVSKPQSASRQNRDVLGNSFTALFKFLSFVSKVAEHRPEKPAWTPLRGGIRRMVEVQPVLRSNVTYGLTEDYSVIACNFPLTRHVGERHLQFARKQIPIQIPLTDFLLPIRSQAKMSFR
jgi:hypothetical protein